MTVEEMRAAGIAWNSPAKSPRWWHVRRPTDHDVLIGIQISCTAEICERQDTIIARLDKLIEMKGDGGDGD